MENVTLTLAKLSSGAISLRQLLLSTADGFNDFADCIDH
jgi:hypothetical protein